jgi:hypothetical protein
MVLDSILDVNQTLANIHKQLYNQSKKCFDEILSSVQFRRTLEFYKTAFAFHLNSTLT